MYRSQQRALFSVLAWTYALDCMVRHAQSLCHPGVGEDGVRVNRYLALTKALVSSKVQEMLLVCRERVGAQGLFLG